ncbi:MarR family winged helix-turn-helix transcriptional regulator [Thalassolituus sp. LLYu03]|uniref:MarR family winged helix-turn-helix transcriptional regulator n=1 Tax=Thalassolituus sp. LLYu03 TaxID=3421656 RepID=UPI003D287BEC
MSHSAPLENTRTELDPTRAASFYIKLIAQELARMAEADLRPLGVGLASLPVLTALSQGNTDTQAELARLLGVEQSSMAQTLVRLERDGLITRSPDPAHGRRQLIALTPLARNILPSSKEVLARGNDMALSDFSAEERELVLKLLVRMLANLTGSDKY